MENLLKKSGIQRLIVAAITAISGVCMGGAPKIGFAGMRAFREQK